MESHQHADIQPDVNSWLTRPLRDDFVTVQVMICPALDFAELSTPSFAEFKDDACESKADLEWFYEQ